MSSITPSIGRKVWYWPLPDEGINRNDPEQACDASVIYVHGPEHVSIKIDDHAGTPHVRNTVLLVDFVDRQPGTASWMPYQEKAAKAAAPEAPTAPMETKVYTDGTSATGPGPLPDLSSAQQDAAAVNQAQSQEAPAASAV